MKNILKFSMLLVILMIAGCEEDQNGPNGTDSTKPGAIENPIIKALHGGVEVTYGLPSDSDLLFVKAVYTGSNGEEQEVLTSAFKNNIQILGLGSEIETTVSLYAVDRSGNNSDAISLTETTLISPIEIVKDNVFFGPGFGTIDVSWEDGLNLDYPIIIDFLEPNTSGVLEATNSEFNLSNKGSRGFKVERDTEALNYAVLIRDSYGNKTDTIYSVGPIKPIVIKRLDKLKIKENTYPDDARESWRSYSAGGVPAMFDNVLSNCCSDANRGNSAGNFNPGTTKIISLDLGVLTKFVGVTFYHRTDWHGGDIDIRGLFNYGNPSNIRVYGLETLPANNPEKLENWTLLTDIIYTRDDGTQTDGDGNRSSYTANELSIVQNGMTQFVTPEEFSQNPRIRYLRLEIYRTFGSDNTSVEELVIFGDEDTQDL